MTLLIDKSFSISVQGNGNLKESRDAASQLWQSPAVIGSEGGPAPAWLDMGIYWRQPRQSAPHLINEPEQSTDQEVYTSELCPPSADRDCNRYLEDMSPFSFTHGRNASSQSAVH